METILAPALNESRVRNSVKLVPASAKTEAPRREASWSLALSSLNTVANLQSLGFGLPTSLIKPPRSLLSSLLFSSDRPKTVGIMANMTSSGPGNGDGEGLRLHGVGKPDSGVVRIGVGRVGYIVVGTCTMDVIVVTTGLPGNRFPVSSGAR